MDRFENLRNTIIPLLRPYARRVSVFGSFARGDQLARSDIDLLIALKDSDKRPTLGLFEFIKLEQELERRLGCEVDLVTEEGLNFHRKSGIVKDRVILYEEE
jgi:predicted nucleotidyltransferase